MSEPSSAKPNDEPPPSESPSPDREPPLDLDARRQQRSRQFVRVSAAFLVGALLFGGCVLWSMIPQIEKDPATVAAALREIAGDLEIPPNFEPQQAVRVRPLWLVRGRVVRYAGPKEGQYLTASLYEMPIPGDDEPPMELPGQAEILLEGETVEQVTVLNTLRPLRIGQLERAEGDVGPTLRAAVLWVPTAKGVLQVIMTGPKDFFDDEQARRTLTSIGR